jgi:hypothetical protein
LKPLPAPIEGEHIIMRNMVLGAALCALVGCSPAQQAAVTADVQKVQTTVSNFEAKAAPVVANACAVFRQAEANPLVNIGVAAGTLAANAATGGAAGPIIADVRAFGDGFCANGPPAGDTTTAAQQATWLTSQVTNVMLQLAGAPPIAAPAS